MLPTDAHRARRTLNPESCPVAYWTSCIESEMEERASFASLIAVTHAPPLSLGAVSHARGRRCYPKMHTVLSVPRNNSVPSWIGIADRIERSRAARAYQ
jgi:hypothetical protein